MPPSLDNMSFFTIENEKTRKMSVEGNMEGEQGGEKEKYLGE
jgi:hypothetical protein